ncbi:hypothetical protein ACWS7L_07405 [Exiguobacterium artemiae]
MTVQTSYLSRVAADLAARIQVIKINDTVVVQKDSITAVGAWVTVKAHSLSGISRITLIKSYDENQNLISVKIIDVAIAADQLIDFVFTWEVKA